MPSRTFAKNIPPLNIAVLGYALFLVINASSLWGGVFPFFPQDFHTFEVTFVFMQAQSLASLAVYVGFFLLAFFSPKALVKPMHMASSLPVFAGGALLIAALYLPQWRLALVAIAGVLIGAGSALLSLLWARYFSAVSMDHGNFYLLCGTLLAPIVFFGFYLVPLAVRVFLMPLVFVPLCGLAVLLSYRGLSKEIPIFQDEPAKHIHTYRHFISTYWRSALAIGALGFASGLTRAAALSDFAMSDITNVASLGGSLVSAGILLLFWQRHSFTLNLNSVYKFCFPLFAIFLAVLPFMNEGRIFLGASALYMLFSVALMVLMLQSAQISRNRGSNPFVVYGFFGSIVGVLQNTGFILGHLMEKGTTLDNGSHFGIAVTGLLVLSLVLYLYFTGFEGGKTQPLPQDNVEFIAMTMGAPHRVPLQLPVFTESDILIVEAQEISPCQEQQKSIPAEDATDVSTYRDLVSKRCQKVQERYRLTSREAEVMEFIVRGYTVAQIAQQFVVSENTVRTHYKHIYAKLDIHKRQELIALIEREDQD